jgi:superoxide reductase
MLKVLKCKHCGNMVKMIEDKGVPVVCCGEPMTVLEPNTTDAALEKHVPVVTVEGSKVTVAVGSVEHPMLPEHYITSVFLETNQAVHEKYLAAGEKPEAVFALNEGEEVVAAYEYCNLHGFWKKEVK